MSIFLTSLVLGAAPMDPLTTYQACVSSVATEAGIRSSISAASADRIVVKCRARLASAAEQMVNQGYKTNAPANMQSRANLLKAAALDIEHQAKMSISAQVLPLPPR